MTILVTGSSGLVGKALKRLSTDEWHFINRNDCDLRCAKQTATLFDTISPSIVIHLAAVVGGLYANIKYNEQMLEDNLLINQNIIANCKRLNCKLISLLSTCIFPTHLSNLYEEQIHDGPPHWSNEGYAYSKRYLEIASRIHNQQIEAEKFSCLIPCNIYGPDDNFNLINCHVIPALIHKCYLAKLGNTPFEILGDGSATRQFIYVDDLAHIILWAVNNFNAGNLIVSPSEEYSVRHIVDAICIITSFKGQVIYKGGINGQLRKYGNNNKLLHLMTPSWTDIYCGLRKTIVWFEENYPNVRK